MLEELATKVEVTRSATRESDAEVSSELKAMGGRFEEASSQVGKLAETVEEIARARRSITRHGPAKHRKRRNNSIERGISSQKKRSGKADGET